MKAPFPYFGGKSAIASKVWRALGQPKHYIEPFFGSGAVLLARPGYDASRHTETVCDKDGHIANVWRSMQFSPDETARWCDWPVNHADLSARKKSLIENEARLLENLIADSEWHDPKQAGYWIWAASCWIGRGMASIGQRPHLGDAGKGVHAIGQVPHLAGGYSDGQGVHAAKKPGRIYEWFQELSQRLRRVRVVCGDWSRVCGGDWQDNIGTVGIFFDPPYGVEDRHGAVYAEDSQTVSHEVRAWALERGSKASYRIVLAGYEDEHAECLDHGWTAIRWKTKGGYANLGDSQGKTNRHRETLFLSPHCETEAMLFSEACA